MKKDFEESLKENIEDLDIAPEVLQEPAEEVKRAEHPEAAISAILFAMGDSVEIKKLSEAIGFTEDETREVIEKMKGKKTIIGNFRLSHEKCLLKLVGVFACPFIVISNYTDGRVDSVTGIKNFVRKNGSIAISYDICSPF